MKLLNMPKMRKRLGEDDDESDKHIKARVLEVTRA